MSRIADALERESRSVDLERGDFERLLGRRERKQRNRRIRAGAVGVIVALVTAAAFMRAIESDRVPAVPPKPLGAAEVLGGSTALTARDPDSAAVRTIVDREALPDRAGSITAAAWSSDSEWVAFRASPQGGSSDGSIWIADTIGGSPRRVATDGRWSPWVWSPTEDRLAVVQGRDVILIDAATGRETDLGTTAEGTEADGVQALVWSPDGTRIAYSGGPGSGSVYAIDVGSGEHSMLVPKPAGAGWVVDIDWSPDGAHLAIRYEGTARGPLYLANADGSDTHLVDRAVAEGGWPDWHPGLSGVGTAWSPDGTRFAYTTFAGQDHEELQVWTISADGSNPSLVASRCCVSDGGAVVWSPDGAQIAVITEEGNGPLSQTAHYVVINADGVGDQTEIDEVQYRSWDGGWYFCFCYG